MLGLLKKSEIKNIIVIKSNLIVQILNTIPKKLKRVCAEQITNLIFRKFSTKKKRNRFQFDESDVGNKENSKIINYIDTKKIVKKQDFKKLLYAHVSFDGVFLIFNYLNRVLGNFITRLLQIGTGAVQIILLFYFINEWSDTCQSGMVRLKNRFINPSPEQKDSDHNQNL
ncbi:hypothetical protein BpHYR1_017630 [Brachionus plicatilis]|uniref:Uncharacterized protein n=1 Tax=Brachionus plicatilis TaxID=10195 RepID=A0A3M7SDZ7_BRAPC|nr:hypothetical protein BpHYR1_017630 [Brachionus plicatilis]